MKKFLLASGAFAAQIASPALAADWPVMVPSYEAVPPPAVYSWWTGCYLGGNLGGAWGRPHYTHDNSMVVEANVYGGITFDHAGRDSAGNSIRFFNSDASIYAITVRASYLFGQPIVTRYVN